MFFWHPLSPKGLACSGNLLLMSTTLALVSLLSGLNHIPRTSQSQSMNQMMMNSQKRKNHQRASPVPQSQEQTRYSLWFGGLVTRKWSLAAICTQAGVCICSSLIIHTHCLGQRHCITVFTTLDDQRQCYSRRTGGAQGAPIFVGLKHRIPINWERF